MSVRAKFFVSDVVQPEGATAAQVSLGVVCRGIENAMWSQFTPAGSITLSIKNDLATEQFKRGEEYEVTFTRVAKPAPNDGHEIVEAVDKNGAVICEFCGTTLRYTEKAVAAWGEHIRSQMNPEKDAERLATHEQYYGRAE